MEGEHPLKGRFKFRDLPFEKVIDTEYELQTKIYKDEDEWFWGSLCKGDYDYVYGQYKRIWSNLECRMLQIETSVWVMNEPDDD